MLPSVAILGLRFRKTERFMIRVENYDKSYRDTFAVQNLSFEVAAGSVLGVVGPNGAGKTTTMRAIAGIIPPSGGRLLVAGHDVVLDPIAAKSQLAFVPDEPQLFGVDRLGAPGIHGVHLPHDFFQRRCGKTAGPV